MKKRYAVLVGVSLIMLGVSLKASAAVTTYPLLKRAKLEITTFNSTRLGNGLSYQGRSYGSHLGYTIGGLTLKIGYQSLGPSFSGDQNSAWLGMRPGQMSFQGKTFSGSYAFSRSLTFAGGIESYQATAGNAAFGSPLGLQAGDRFSHFQLGVGYGLTGSDAVDLGFEHVTYTLQAGQPVANSINLGVGHTFNPNASVKFLYQIVRYDDKGTGFDPSANGGKVDKGVAVGQFSLKF